MYRLARKSTKIFNSYITSFEGFNVPGFGVVRFFHPISTASFTDNAIEMLKKTYVGRVIASILENLNNIDYYTSWCRDFHDDPSYKENMTSILTEKLIERNIRDFRLSFDRHDYINQGIVIYGSIIIEI
jgi:hypothetical protein